jgi:hypothetical protein
VESIVATSAHGFHPPPLMQLLIKLFLDKLARAAYSAKAEENAGMIEKPFNHGNNHDG